MKGVVGPGGQGGFGRAGIWRQAGKAIAGAGWPGLTACVARRRRQPWDLDMGTERGKGTRPDPDPDLAGGGGDWRERARGQLQTRSAVVIDREARGAKGALARSGRRTGQAW